MNSVRWVLERGEAQQSGDGRWWGSTARSSTSPRAARPSRRCASTRSPRHSSRRSASRTRILDAAYRARRDIERNLHDGAQQRLVSVALGLRIWLARHGDLPEDCWVPVLEALGELTAGLAELRDLARGLHPAVLSDHGLEHGLRALAQRAAVPVELETALPEQRLPMAVEVGAYFVAPRCSPTSTGTPRRAGRPSVSRSATGSSTSRSTTTASAGRTPAPARGCRACATGSPPSTGRSRSTTGRGSARSCGRDSLPAG